MRARRYYPGIIAAAFLAAMIPDVGIAQTLLVEPPGDADSGMLIVGGEEINESVWPATLKFASIDNVLCTGTVIGQHTFLTAAHCARDKEKLSINTGAITTTATCTRHSQYSNITGHFDIALCKSTDPFVLRYTQRFERLNKAQGLITTGLEITLLGYGCRKHGGGGARGKLFQGFVEVSEIADPEIITRNSDNDVALCSGDSGGASYTRLSQGRRVIVAVGARTDRVSVSYLTNLTHPDVWQFIDTWSKSNGKICGINEVEDLCQY